MGPLGFVWRAWKYRSFGIARIIQRNLGTIVTATNAKERGVEIPELGIVINPFLREDILRTLPELISLRHCQRATFELGAENNLDIHINGLSIPLENLQEILLAHEIFGDRVYDVAFNGEALVWDIGANVGMASLFLARSNNWQVIAYEPFPQTAERALENIKRNHLGGKIELVTAGIGGSERTETLTYHEEWRLGNGLFGNTDEKAGGTAVCVNVRILDAAIELQRIHTLADGRLIIAKIDCEGAEYEILRRLRDTGQLKMISIILLEVHQLSHEDPNEPKRILLDSGMVVLRHEHFSESLQIMYAVRLPMD